MKRSFLLMFSVFSLLLLLLIPVQANQWFKVACHDHTRTYSDGDRSFDASVQTAKRFGFDTLIISDHLDKIAVKSDFATYLSDFQKDYSGITVISGVEVETGTSHTVVFGSLTSGIMDELNSSKTVPEVIAIAQKYNLLAVAAHPFDPSFTYDRANADGINGEEWFNGLTVGYTKLMDWFKTMQTDGKDIFNWAGIDSHSLVDPSEVERWRRETWVCARSNSPKDITEAFRLGRTYASRFGYRIDGLNLIPGFALQAEKPCFRFKVVPKPIAEIARHINLYRDNQVIKSWTILQGATSKSVDFIDESCPAGEHTYFIEISDVLVTSVIRLEVTDQPESVQAKKSGGLLNKIADKIRDQIRDQIPRITGANAPDIADILGSKPKDEKTESTNPAKKIAEEDKVTAGSGYLNLLGLDFNGVIARMGRQPDGTWENNGGVVSTVVLGWLYKNKPLPNYLLVMHFDHYNNLGSNETLKIIHTVCTICQDMKQAVPPRKIVSANVLDSKPQMILLNGPNSITIVWFMDGMTYALGLTDTNRKLIENRKSVNSKGILANKCFLTAAGKNFRSCNRTEFFVCVDREIEIFPPRGSMRYYADNRGFIDTYPTGVIVFKFDQ